MYNRDYLTDQSNSHSNESSQRQAYIMSFLKATYQLFAGSMLAATAGAYIGLEIVSALVGMHWILFIAVMGLVFFVIPRVKHKQGINLVALFGVTFLTGLMIAPLLASILAMPGGAAIAGQAFLMTSIAFGGISMFAMTTKKDFSFMGGFLFASFWILFAAGIIFALGTTFGWFAYSSIFHLFLSSGIAILMCGFILYDTQQIIKGNYDSPVEAALSLYLDFFNLFVSLLQILGIMRSND
ncbi:Bax inhibitor-1/YccA family protein [Arcobacter lanthieri]|uniref:Bax inhibitor-1/YccA family protein n=1 Tax=Aliarcobacter lanthieri TaxID=1355374 RepID=UPI0019204099|nr:Bax inhibitor-1/YccA family protein [Aliarcobacter lanthieri]MBL3520127.1 Bax inhibitor-1/YccA family protein [Aliarcobacter lanthieri]